MLLALVTALLLAKAAILTGLARVFRLPLGIAVAVGIMLAQGGEFGFVLFSLARQEDVLTEDIAQLAALVVALTMAITPLLLEVSRRLARRLERRADPGSALARDAAELGNHVVIAGYGRVGETLALLLESEGRPIWPSTSTRSG